MNDSLLEIYDDNKKLSCQIFSEYIFKRITFKNIFLKYIDE